MSEPPDFLERLALPRPVVMDGAVNTELTRNGYVFNTADWLRANLDAPEALETIHASYARAGAEVHIANSFSAARYVLEDAGLAADFEPMNRAAVTVCRDAIDAAAAHPQWIAGSISTYATDHDRRNLPPPDRLEQDVAAQAAILADAGCDLLALEMLTDVDNTVAMLLGAATTGLPISIGLVCTEDASGQVLLYGSGRSGLMGKEDMLLGEALPGILDRVPAGTTAIVTIMHSELDCTGPALSVVREHWDGPVAAYPNNGHYVAPGGWDTSAGCSPEQFVARAEAWVGLGASIVGGCCGVGPEHIGALAQRLSAGAPCC